MNMESEISRNADISVRTASYFSFPQLLAGVLIFVTLAILPIFCVSRVAFAAESHADTTDYCIQAQSVEMTAQEVRDGLQNHTILTSIIDRGELLIRYRAADTDYADWPFYQGNVQGDITALANADLTSASNTYDVVVYVGKQSDGGVDHIIIPVTVTDSLSESEAIAETPQTAQPDEEVLENYDIATGAETSDDSSDFWTRNPFTMGFTSQERMVLTAGMFVSALVLLGFVPFIVMGIYLVFWHRRKVKEFEKRRRDEGRPTC